MRYSVVPEVKLCLLLEAKNVGWPTLSSSAAGTRGTVRTMPVVRAGNMARDGMPWFFVETLFYHELHVRLDVFRISISDA
jgi:hypothetical protein